MKAEQSNNSPTGVSVCVCERHRAWSQTDSKWFSFNKLPDLFSDDSSELTNRQAWLRLAWGQTQQCTEMKKNWTLERREEERVDEPSDTRHCVFLIITSYISHVQQGVVCSMFSQAYQYPCQFSQVSACANLFLLDTLPPSITVSFFFPLIPQYYFLLGLFLPQPKRLCFGYVDWAVLAEGSESFFWSLQQTLGFPKQGEQKAKLLPLSIADFWFCIIPCITIFKIASIFIKAQLF